MMTVLEMFILWWCVCGVLFAGIDYAYYQNKFPRQAEADRFRDYFKAILFGMEFGPIALTHAFFDSDYTKYGWRFIPYPNAHPMYKIK